jgi:hypothetical protein
LFINQLGQELNISGLGIDLGPLNVSSIFFADDIVLIGRDQTALDKLMAITRTFFDKHKLVLSETKSKLMSHNATTGKTTFRGFSSSPISLEAVLNFKYLGVKLSCSPHNMFRSFNDQVKKKAQNYLASVLSLVKTGPDRSSLAHTLWTSCAVPSILYGSEVIPLTLGTITEVERCQSIVGKFILQVPRSSANVSAHLDGGLKPIWAVLAEKVMLYAYKTMEKPPSYWARMALTEHITLGSKSPYARYLMKWKAETNCFGLHPKQIRATVTSSAISFILSEQRKTCATTFAMNGPGFTSSQKWFKPKTWVSDSCNSQVIAQFRTCNCSQPWAR